MNGFHRCQGLKGVSQAPGRLLHQLVEQHVALAGCHLVFTDRGDTRKKGGGAGVVIIPVYSLLPQDQPPSIWDQRSAHTRESVGAAAGMGQEWRGRPFSPRVIVDMPASLAPAQGCVVAVVDAARVVAKGVQLIDGASCGSESPNSTVTAVPTPTLPPSQRSAPGPSLPDSPALSLAKSPRLSRCSGKSTPTELFLMEPREAENRLRSKP